MEGLVGQMRDLATHNRGDATRTSKRDKAALRTAFRSILASVEGAGAKVEKVRRGCPLRRWGGAPHPYMFVFPVRLR